jgi:hypothetical protein
MICLSGFLSLEYLAWPCAAFFQQDSSKWNEPRYSALANRVRMVTPLVEDVRRSH